MNTMQKFESLIAIYFTGRIWTGERSLARDDLESVDGLPPAAITKLGTKDVFDKEKLQVFHRLKREAERELLATGFPFLGGIAIPITEAERATSVLNDVKNRFETERDQFVAQYDSNLESFIAAYPDFADKLRQAALGVGEVKARLSFDWVPIQVGAVKDNAAMAEVLQKTADGLAGTLYKEISKMAQEIQKQYLKDRTVVDGKFLRCFANVRRKMAALAFVDDGIQPLVDTIDQVIAEVPEGVKIGGLHLITLKSLLVVLSDEHQMQELAKTILSGVSAKEAFVAVSPNLNRRNDFVVPTDLFSNGAMTAIAPEKNESVRPLIGRNLAALGQLFAE